MSLSRAAFKTRQAGAAHGPLHPGWVHSDIMVLLLGAFQGMLGVEAHPCEGTWDEFSTTVSTGGGSRK